MLRQQLIVAARTTERPQFATHERGLLVLLARFVPRWRDAILLVKPETILRWHREGFRLLWRLQSKPKTQEPKLAAETIASDPEDGRREPALGSRAHSRRAPEARHPRREANGPTVHARCATDLHRIAVRAGRPFLRQPHGLGLRLPADLRHLVPSHLRILHRRRERQARRPRCGHARAHPSSGPRSSCATRRPLGRARGSSSAIATTSSVRSSTALPRAPGLASCARRFTHRS